MNGIVIMPAVLQRTASEMLSQSIPHKREASSRPQSNFAVFSVVLSCKQECFFTLMQFKRTKTSGLINSIGMESIAPEKAELERGGFF
jgi:hypothetical protein